MGDSEQFDLDAAVGQVIVTKLRYAVFGTMEHDIAPLARQLYTERDVAPTEVVRISSLWIRHLADQIDEEADEIGAAWMPQPRIQPPV